LKIKKTKWLWLILLLLLIIIAGGIYYSFSLVEEIGYYSDEPYPTADGIGFFVTRILNSEKLASHLPPAEIEVDFICFPSTSSEGEKISTVKIDFESIDFNFGVKGGNLYYITSTLPDSAKGKSLKSIPDSKLKRKFYLIKSNGQKKETADMPPGQYILKNPTNILFIKDKREIYNYEPLTGKKRFLCKLPRDYDIKRVKILPGNNPDCLLYLVESRETGVVHYYFSRKLGKTVKLKDIAGKNEMGVFAQFETFNDNIINFFPFSDTPLFLFTDTMKLTPEKVPTSVFKLSPDGSRIAYTSFQKKLYLYNLNTKQYKLLYKENRTDHFIHRYFWLPSENNIILHLTIPTSKESVTVDEVIAVNPDTGKTSVILEPCPAYRYGKSKYFQFIRGIKDKINKAFKKKILP